MTIGRTHQVHHMAIIQYLIAMLSKYELVLLLKFREGCSRGYVCEGVVDY
jgi:hypothetical protein